MSPRSTEPKGSLETQTGDPPAAHELLDLVVPTKIVWLTLTGLVSDAQWCHVPLSRAFAIRVSE